MKTLQREVNLKTAPQDIKLTTVKAITKRPNTLFRFERPDYRLRLYEAIRYLRLLPNAANWSLSGGLADIARTPGIGSF
jgi:hypothetical protein